jgi:acyl-homoserine-lactone acylase
MAIIIKRSLFGLAILLLLVALFLAFWEPYFAKPILGAAPAERDYKVEIIRDDYGVPHIFGKTDADVSYGIAWAHSEDDFYTLQNVAAMTRGRLGAITGAEGAQVDYVAHLLKIGQTAEQKYDALPADVRALLDGYAAGMNRYAETHPEEVSLSGLFPLNGRDIAAGFALRSPFFYGLNRVLEPLVAGEELRPDGGPALNGIKESIDSNTDKDADKDKDADSSEDIAQTVQSAARISKIPPRMTPLGKHPELNGSNAFAIKPERSTDNVTRLVSNTHQPWEGPVAWYELVVHSEEGWDFAGATFPGSPFPFLGHNKNLGWTNTVNRPDLIDVYELTVDDAGKRYKLDGQWQELESRQVWLPVKYGPFTIPYPQTVYRSAHGPVIKNDKGYFAVRYASIDDLTMLTQYYRIQKAQNFDEWQEAMALQGVPSTNFIYADREGNIGMFYNARFPDRKAGVDWRGIVPGDRSDLIWQQPVSWNSVPRLVNPASGYVMNANNTPYTTAGPGDELKREDFSPLLGIEENWTNRGARAIALLEAEDLISREALERIKYDTGYVQDKYPKLWMDKLLAVDVGDDDNLKQAQTLLAAWDWNMDGKNKGDALALMLMNTGLFNAPLGRSLVDDLDAKEELEKTVDHLQTHFGTIDPPLGDVLRLRHGDVDLPYIGGSDALRASTRWDVDDDGRLSIVHGDSFLMFVEWDEQGNVSSQSINPFGSATTRPDSEHYTDQSPLFVKRQLKPLLFTREKLEDAGFVAYRPQ